jgi:PAS domain S-box-containing protein
MSGGILLNATDTNLIFQVKLMAPKPSYEELEHRIQTLESTDIFELEQSKQTLQKRAEELIALNTLGQELITTKSLQQTCAVGLRGMVSAVCPDLAFLFLRHEERLILQNILPPLYRQRLGDIPEHRVGECLCGLVVKENRPVYSRNIVVDPRCTWEACKKAGLISFAALPLLCAEETIGVIGLASETLRDFELQAGFLETLASLVAVSLANARLFDAVQQELAERKRAETSAHADRERLQTLLQYAPVGIFLIDESGRFSYANPKFKEIFGYDLMDIPDGKTWFRLVYPDTHYRKQVISDWMHDLNAHQAGEQRPRVFDVICKDGGKKTINFIPVSLANGENIVVCEDITERLTLEDQLQHAQRMEAVGILAGGVAHDFNNLLQAISGYTQIMMLDKIDGDPDLLRLKAIDKSIARAAQLVRQLLLFSRKEMVERRNVNLSQEMGQVVRILERTIPRMIEIELHPGTRLWTVKADPAQIEQALLNLGINASDAMPDGGRLTIEIRNAVVKDMLAGQRNGIPAGNYVLVRVSDTGCGMSKETLDHIYEPFFTTKGIGKGTGLGLASVYGIVKSHGGYINCESVSGKGTTFTIYLPAIETEDPDVVLSPSETPPNGGAETILVVDDVPDIRHLAMQMLQHFGYTVMTAASGEEAIELHLDRKSAIDLTILDLGMPGIGGSRCLQELLAINPFAKILIASGYCSDDTVKNALKSGAAGFIGKPYQLPDLLSRVRIILGRPAALSDRVAV